MERMSDHDGQCFADDVLSKLERAVDEWRDEHPDVTDKMIDTAVSEWAANYCYEW